MRLSKLQKYILKACVNYRSTRISKKIIEGFYQSTAEVPKNIVNIITKSVDRLIAKELIVGYGRKTAKKWFIYNIRLTPRGKKIARTLQGKQQTLPLK